MKTKPVTSKLAFLGVALSAAISIQGTALAQAVKVDQSIPSYEKTSGVSGNLNSIGSDTLNNLMTLWAEGFKAVYPNVNVQIEGKGSSTAPPALTARFRSRQCTRPGRKERLKRDWKMAPAVARTIPIRRAEPGGTSRDRHRLRCRGPA